MHVLVRQLISQSNKSLSQISKKSGVTYSTVQRFVTDGKDIKANNLISILEALDVDVLTFIKEKTVENKIKTRIPSYISDSFKDILKGVGFGA